MANLGDSVPFGAGVSDNETYPYYLDSLLRSYNQCSALNAGVPSYNLRQTFYHLQHSVMKLYHPALVTVQAANDMSLLTQYCEQWNPGLTWAQIRWNRELSDKNKIATLFYLSSILKKKTERHQKCNSGKMLEYIDNSLLPDFIDFCHNSNVAIVFLSVNPFYYSDVRSSKNMALKQWNHENEGYIELWDSIYIRYNDLLRIAAEEYEHVYYLDIRSEFDQLNRDALYIDFIHYSPEGNKIIAQKLFNFLIRNNLINSTSDQPNWEN